MRRRSGSPVGRLPVRTTTFVGRHREARDTRALLDAVRLVVLVGPGGCGKSRLALHVAEAADHVHPDGGWWVDLASTESPGGVAVAVARALEVPDRFGGTWLEAITATIGGSSCLVVMDNCEHVVEGVVPVITATLERCPGVRILATSRSPLGVDGEVLFRVPPLEVPDEDAPAEHVPDRLADAVRLFVDRAQATDPGFVLDAGTAPGVAAICRTLEGLPLAIELAAANVDRLDLDDAQARLGSLAELSDAEGAGRDPRQRTLAASVSWSFELLAPADRLLLCRLSVFPDAFTLAAARRVAGAGADGGSFREAMTALIERSLVETDARETGVRYRLPSLVREHAARLLDAEPQHLAAARAAYVTHYREVVAEAERTMRRGGAAEVLDALRPEEPNLVAAISVAEARGDADAVVALASSPYWVLTGRNDQARDAIDRLLTGGRCPADLEATAWSAGARLALDRWDVPAAVRMGERAVALLTVGERPGAAEAMAVLGAASLWAGDPGRARELLPRAAQLAELGGDGRAVARSAVALGQTPFAIGRHREALDLFEEAGRTARREGELRTAVEADVYLFLIHWFAGRDAEAAAVCGRAIEDARLLHSAYGQSLFLSFSAALEIQRGVLEPADELLREAERLATVSGHPLASAHRLSQSAFLTRARGDLDQAIVEFTVCRDTARAVGVPIAAILHAAWLADLVGAAGDAAAAAENAALARAWQEEIGASFPHVPWAEAVVAYLSGAPGTAADRAHAAVLASRDAANDLVALESLEVFALAAEARGRSQEAARLLGSIDAIRAERGWWRVPHARHRYERAAAALRVALGGDGFAATTGEGARLGLDDAIAYAARGRGERGRPAAGWASLSPSELQVAELVASGLPNAAVADRLFVSVATVKSHLTHIYAKLGITSRVQLSRAHADRGQ